MAWIRSAPKASWPSIRLRRILVRSIFLCLLLYVGAVALVLLALAGFEGQMTELCQETHDRTRTGPTPGATRVRAAFLPPSVDCSFDNSDQITMTVADLLSAI